MPNFLVNVAVAVLKTVGMKAAAVAAIGQTGLAVIGGSILVGGALVAKKVMGLFEIQMPKIDTDASRQSTNKGTTEPHKIIYGETLVSGPVVFVATAGTDNKDLYYAVALAGHEVEDITDIHFDNEVIADADIAATTSTASTSGAVSGSGTFGPKGSPSTTICHVNRHLGTATQAADSLLRAAKPSKWTTAHQGKGIAYIVTKWVLNDDSAETWDKFTPNNIKAVVKGRKIYDPRLDSTQTDISGSGSHRLADSTTWAYSTNPALAVADYLMNADFGLGVSSSKIDWAAIKTAADGCDVSVSVPGGTQSRFTCNGVLFGTDSHKTNINKLLSAMNGSIAYIDGYYVVKAGIHENPVVDLDEDDLSGSISIKTSLERGDRFNTVKGVFIDPASNYKSTEFPKVQLSTAYSRDNDEELHKEIALNMTNSSYMAQRIAHKLIQQSDLQKIITYPTNMKGLRVAVGDRVRVTNTELSWSLKEFQCVQWSFNEEGGVTLLLREENSAKYADPTVTPNNEYSTVTSDGVLEDAFRGVPTPSGLRVVSGEGKVFLDWVNPGNPQEFQTVHVLVSSDNNLANAVKAGETDGSQFVHDSAASAGDATEYAVGDTRYYWVRAVNFVGTSNEARSSAHGSQSVTVLATAVTWSNVANPTIGIQLDTDDSIEIVYNAQTQTSGSAIATSGIEEDVTITQGGITMSSGGAIKGGQTAFNSGTGFFLGYHSSAYKFSIGNSSGEKLTFDGSNLAVTGDITATSGTFTGTVNASAGAFTGDVTTNSKFTAGSSNDVAIVDGGDALYRFYAGDASSENAAFRVDKDGHIDARDIKIYDENGQVILDVEGFHGSGLGNISANSGIGVSEVAGKLDNNADEITFTTGTADEAYTFETKVQIDINQDAGSGETPTTSNLSFAGADQSAVTTIINQVKLIVEYFVKTSGGSYSGTPDATDEFEFVSGTTLTSPSSQLGVNVFTLGSRGAGVVYANVGASEAIADPSISGARLFVKSTKNITFSSAATHNIKVNARIATTGTNGSTTPAGTTLTTSTTPALDDSVTTGTGVILGSDETQTSLENFRRLYTIKPASGNTKTIIASTTDDTFSSTGGSSLLTSGGTISGSLIVTQDLTVQGTTTTLDTTNTLIKDALIELNSGHTGANTNDTGLILERGSTGDNVFIGWDESSDRVTFATTTATGASSGNLTLTATDIQAGAIFSGAITASADSTITTAGFTRLNINSTRTSGNIGGVDFQASGTIKGQIYGTVDGQIKLATNGSTVAATFDASQNATIAGSLTATALNLGDNSTNEIPIAFLSSSTDFALGANGNNFMITQSTGDLDGTPLLTISSAGNASFVGTITASGGVFQSTGATAITLEDTDNGFAASQINVQNGGRDLKITAPQDIIFNVGSSDALTILNGGAVTSTITSGVGIRTTYGLFAQFATDSQIDLVSSSAGTWGSAINFVEGANTSNTDVWSIARKTTGGSGDSSLHFNFGTTNSHENTSRVSFSSAGSATFAGDISTSSANLKFTGTGGYVSTTGAYALRLQTNNTEALRLTSSQNAVFAGSIDSGNITSTGVINMNHDGAALYLGADIDMRLTHDGANGTLRNDTGTLTVDVGGDIILDAAGNDVIFKDAGTTFGQITNDSGNLILYNAGSQMLKGLSLGSNAQFMGEVFIPEKLSHSGDTDTHLKFAGANDIRIVAGDVEHAAFDGTIVFNQSGADMDLRVESTGNQNMLMVDAGNDRVAIGHNAPTATLDVAGTANFSGDVTQTTGDFIYSGNINWDIKHTGAGQNIVFSTTPSGGSTTEVLRITSTGDLAKIVGALTLDVAGDLHLDAGGQIKLDNDGTTFGIIFNSSNDLGIHVPQANKDFVVSGNDSDGGGTVNALKLDMSAAGKAIFNAGATFGSTTTHYGNGAASLAWGNTSDVGALSFSGSNAIVRSTVDNADIIFQGNSSGYFTALTLDMSNAGEAFFNDDINLGNSKRLRMGAGGNFEIFSDGSNNYIKGASSDEDLIFQGVDGGSAITALRLDMSQGGEADFLGAVKVGGAIVAHQTNRGVFEYASNTFKIRSYGATSGSGAFTISTGGGGGSADTVALSIDSSQNSSFAGTISSGAITSGSHLINASSSAFGGSSVQGFNTDFVVDTGQGYSRHNSYHTGGSNHQFLVNAAGSTTNTIALEINKDADVKASTSVTTPFISLGSTSNSYQTVTGSSDGNDLTYRAYQNHIFKTTTGASSSTDGTERLRIDSGGNAIFTKSGGAYLQLKDSSAVRGSINVETTDGLVFTTGASFTERMRIDGSTGNVGIGSSPDSRLHVHAASAGSVTALSGTTLTVESNANNYLSLLSPDANLSAIVYGSPSSTNNASINSSYNSGSPYLNFNTAGAERFRTSASGTTFSGNVAINKSLVSTVSLSVAAPSTSTSAYGLEVANGSSNTRFLVDGVGNSWWYNTSNSIGMRWDAVNNRLAVGHASPDFTLDVKADKDTWISRIYNTGSDANAQGLLVRSDATSAHDALVFGAYADSSYKVVVKSTGKVGIGTSSPSNLLSLKSGTNTDIEFGSESSGGFIQTYNRTSSTYGYLRFITKSGGTARFDADGNFLVGKDADDFTTAGTAVNQAGEVQITRSSATPLYIRRNSDSGELIGFYQAGSAVGSIGTIFDDLYIGTDDTCIRFDDTNNAITPRGAGGAARDAAIDIGTSSVRFRHVSLSGGVYVGNGSESAPTMTFDSDTDTGFYRYSSGKISMTANGTEAMRMSGFGLDMTMNSSAQFDLNRSGFITFYGTGSSSHAIGSRNASGTADDDIRINSFGAVFINLDSNNNDTSDTHNSFFIGRHGAGAGTIDQLLRVHGASGDLTTEGNVTAFGSTSDIRLKENIEVIPNALEKVQKLRGITFNYKNDGSRSTGLIAQELEEVLPEVVYTATELDGENEHLAVRYGNTVGLLVEAIKEQQQQIETLKQTIEEMKNGSNKDEQD